MPFTIFVDNFKSPILILPDEKCPSFAHISENQKSLLPKEYPSPVCPLMIGIIFCFTIPLNSPNGPLSPVGPLIMSVSLTVRCDVIVTNNLSFSSNELFPTINFKLKDCGIKFIDSISYTPNLLGSFRFDTRITSLTSIDKIQFKTFIPSIFSLEIDIIVCSSYRYPLLKVIVPESGLYG